MIKVGGHRVLVKPLDITDIDPTYSSAKKAGLYVPEQEKEREQNAVDRGTIIQIGATAHTDFDGDLWFNTGDTVMYARYSGKKVNDPATEEIYLILNAEDVLCVLGD